MSFTKICNYCSGDGYIYQRKPFVRYNDEDEEEVECSVCYGRGLIHEDVDEKD